MKGPQETARPDMVIFINGIPLVVIECKSPVAKQTDISRAIKQLKRYQEDDKFPNMADHPTVREMLELGLLKDEDLSENPTAREVLIAGILNKANLLDIIQNFVVFEQERTGTIKKISRYQQFTASNKIGSSLFQVGNPKLSFPTIR